MKEFRAKYVTASELGVLHKLSSRIIPARLRSVGVEPVGGPELDGTIIYIFERSKVAEVRNIRLTKDEFEKASKSVRSNCRDYAQGFLSLKQTMKILNFSKHEISELEKRGFLKRVKL